MMMNSSYAMIEEQSDLITHLYAQEDDPDLLHQQLQSQQNDDQEDDYETPPQPYSSAPAASAVLPRLSPPAITDVCASHRHHHRCSSCGAHNTCGRHHRMKRRLPFSSSSSASAAAGVPVPVPAPTESKTKKQLLLEQQEQQDRNFSHHGFTKITLPESFSSPPSSADGPSKRRSIPATPSPVKGSPPQVHPFGFSPVPSSLPPLPPHPLRRTTSDPTPATAMANLDDSPSSRRLKRMRNQLKEMSVLWDRVLSEDEQDEDDEVSLAIAENKAATKDDEAALEDEGQETVSVEVVGEALSLNFNCACGKGYQILLSGRNLYYKLV